MSAFGRYWDLAPELLAVLDSQGNFKSLNQSWYTLLRLETASWVGRSLSELLHADDCQSFFRLLERVKSEPVAQDAFRIVADPQRVVRVPFQLIREDGELLLVGRSISVVNPAVSGMFSDTGDSREFIQTILDAIPDPIFVKDEGHRWIFGNRAFSELLGRSHGEYLGKSDYDVFSPEMADGFWQKDNEIMRLQTANEYEELIADPSGGENRTILTKKTPAIRSDGERILVGVIRDITERKKLEREIHDNREFLQTVLNGSPSVIYVKDIDGRYIFVNREYEKVLGIPAETMLGKNQKDFFSEEISREFDDEDHQVIREKRSFQFENQIEVAGKKHTYLTSKFPLFGAQGEVLAVCGISTDITEHLELQDQFEVSRQRLEVVIKAMKLGIWDWDIKNDILVWDDFNYEIFGIKKEDFTGAYQAFEKQLVPEDAKRLQASLQNAFDTQSDFKDEFRVRRDDGEIRIVRAESKGFYDENGQVIKHIGVNWDVTDQRQQEMRLLQTSKMSSLGEMAGGVAHEINNPLTIIIGKAQIISRLLAKPELDIALLRKHLDAIESTAHRIAQIVRGLRNFARDGTQDPFDQATVSSLIEDMLALCQSRFSSHAIDLQIVDRAGEERIECRPTQLLQILLNLMSNAFDAVEGTPERWVRVETRDVGVFVEFIVSDSGRGIPREIQDKILQPFFTTKNVGRGTGLGLSIASAFAKAHHGTLELDVSRHHTTFVLRLPKKH